MENTNVTEFISDLEFVEPKFCPKCFTTLQDFLNDGFLGCPNCYKVFEKEIQNYIHSTQASTNHIGKAYFVVGENDKSKLIHLEQELKLAINEQRFEDCLNLKNQIDKIKENLNG